MRKFYIILVATCFCLTLFYFGSGERILQTNRNLTNSFPAIIVDAGHGGFDGGAVAKDSTIESHLNLEISKKTTAIFRLFGYKVINTRTEDVGTNDEGLNTIRNKKSTDLHNRLKLMSESEIELYLSIHQNMFTQSKYWGTQVFHSPNSEQAKLYSQSIQSSVKNLLQNENKREIKRATKDVFLIYNATKPAVLVECGFMSNAFELSKLKDNTYQKQMGFSIFHGIINSERIS